MKTLELVCPKCKGKLRQSEMEYYCGKCDKTFPILFGIPDFRLRSDQYLSLEEERLKAQRLFDKSKNISFIELLEYYYSITDDVPKELAKRYIAYNLSAVKQGELILSKLDDDQCRSLIDVGCGAGGTLVAAGGHFEQIVGVDIALRWLVIAQKRLMELGINAQLICADVEKLPFKSSSCDLIVANDLLEHVHDVSKSSKELISTLGNNGKIWISASNRYFIGPNPSTRMWAIGFMPKSLRTWLLNTVRGVDSLRFIHLVSPYEIKKYFNPTLKLTHFGPKSIPDSLDADYPFIDQLLIKIYQVLQNVKLIKLVLFYAGPAFEMIFTKNKPTMRKE